MPELAPAGAHALSDPATFCGAVRQWLAPDGSAIDSLDPALAGTLRFLEDWAPPSGDGFAGELLRIAGRDEKFATEADVQAARTLLDLWAALGLGLL